MSLLDGADRYLIITSDAHGGASSPAYKEFIEARWHDQFDVWLAAITNPWVDLRDPDRARLNWDSDARVRAMDADGVSAEVVFPNTLPPFFDILAHLSGVPRTSAELAPRWAGLQAHNRWLVAFCREAPLRRKGVVQLLPNDIDAAVAEVRWAANSGVAAGVMLPAIPPNHPVPPYFHDRYDRLWAACTETGMPVHQHQGTGSPDVGDDTQVGRSIFFAELDTWTKRTLLHLIVGGVFERHPQLRVVWTEMWGMQWAVDEIDRMSRRLKNIQTRYASDPDILNYAQTFGSAITDGLTASPLEYFHRNCWLGASVLPRHDVRYRHVLGVDRIMWGTDFPHNEGSAPFTTEALRTTLFDVPVDECRAMLGTNAAALYGFDLDALAPIAAAIGPRVVDVAIPMSEAPRHPGEAFSTDLPLALGAV